MITQEYLRTILHYNPETGIFIWKIQMSNRMKIGEIAGFINNHGYVRIGIKGRICNGHTLAWLYVYGEWVKHLDHKNRNKSDNRICNLRLADKSKNACNSKDKSNNTSGQRGVRFYRNAWKARIKVGYEEIHLGTFDTKEQATQAYIDASRHYHKEFSVYS